MRRAARTDENQPEIVKALRKIGARVHITSALGGGFPDLCCAYRGKNVLIEVKMPGEKLTRDQVEFVATWGGEMHIVESPEEAVAALVGKEAMK